MKTLRSGLTPEEIKQARQEAAAFKRVNRSIPGYMFLPKKIAIQ
jgi:hypothetical protein